MAGVSRTSASRPPLHEFLKWELRRSSPRLLLPHHFCPLPPSPQRVEELEQLRLNSMSGAARSQEGQHGEWRDARPSSRPTAYSPEVTSADLIASIKFSTRPEDVVFLHLKDGA